MSFLDFNTMPANSFWIMPVPKIAFDINLIAVFFNRSKQIDGDGAFKGSSL